MSAVRGTLADPLASWECLLKKIKESLRTVQTIHGCRRKFCASFFVSVMDDDYWRAWKSVAQLYSKRCSLFQRNGIPQ